MHLFDRFKNNTERPAKSFTISVALLVIVIFVFSLIAEQIDLYFKITWLDNAMHFSGGVFIGLLWLYSYYHLFKTGIHHTSRVFVFISAISVATLIGVLWEVFEYVSDFVAGTLVTGSSLERITYVDTLTDIVMDMTGALVAAIIFIIIWQKK